MVTALSEAVRKIIHVDMEAFYASVEQRDIQTGRPQAWPLEDLQRRFGKVGRAYYAVARAGVLAMADDVWVWCEKTGGRGAP